jgi:peptide/nickel transport system permease protein
MAGSIRGSATSEPALVPVEEPRPLAGRTNLLRRLLRTPGGLAGIVLTLAVVLGAIFADQISPDDPFASVGLPLQPPSLAHPMGTDDLGRDVLSGVLHGTRTSLVVVLVAVTLASAIGVTVGAVSGYRGGLLDDVLMRITEAFQAVPRFFLAIVVIALFGAGLDRLVLLLGLTSWTMLARVVRAEVLSIKEQEFVEAARSFGASDARILVRELLPNVLPSAIVVVSLMAASVILLEAALGFLGLGDPDVISLGYLVNNAQRFIRVAWWMAVFPGAAITVAVLGLNLLGDAINDLLDPHSVR